MFQKVPASLPRSLRKILRDHTGEDSFSAHDLRHTCAVVRLNQFLSSGLEMTDALERTRVFFGWSRDSVEPLRYTRAVSEDGLHPYGTANSMNAWRYSRISPRG